MTVGAILAGGASRRMGSPKALVEYGGMAMGARVAGALAAGGCQPVVLIGGSQSVADTLELGHLADRHPGAGPLGGILTALCLGAPCFVAACDLPLLDGDTVAALITALADHDVAIAHGAGRPQPLCAVWSGQSMAAVEAAFTAGERAVHRVLAVLDVVNVEVDPTTLLNVNAPDDLTTP